MTFDVNLTDTSAAIIGGSLIAIASTLNLLFNGKITGLSGIFFGLASCEKNSNWKLAFLNGMLITSCGMKKFSRKNFFNTHEEFLGDISLIGLIISAFLVGLGTKLANGCTSGHGVCGISRLSLRSIVAVTVFMLTGVGVATLRYHFPFFSNGNLVKLAMELNTPLIETIFMIIFCVNFLIFFFKCVYEKDYTKGMEFVLSFLFGCIFSAGLIISGMCQRTKILDFLTISPNWDISLLYVMLSAVVINFFTFYYIIKIREKPIISDSLQLPSNKDINLQLIIGSFIFGIGWGIGGLCPGPALVASILYIPHMMIFLVFLALGQFFCVFVEDKIIKWISSKIYGKLIELK
jgi:uncharacterized membrane protein YedE/YeeE